MPHRSSNFSAAVALAGGGALALTLLAIFPVAFASAADVPRLLPAPSTPAPRATSAAPQTAVLAGGCFWGVQGVFEHVQGVEKVLAGYSGGSKATANYETVSTGITGHAESVKITYDPQQISYGQILRIFFSVALNPTERDRQGPDVGTQYRSEIFYADPEQQYVAVAYIAQLNQAHVFARPIATRVDRLTGFYPAEQWHQDFMVRNPENPYIVYNDVPKVEALKQLFPAEYHAMPMLALPTHAAS